MYPGYKSLIVDHMYGSISAFFKSVLLICMFYSVLILHSFDCYSFWVRLKSDSVSPSNLFFLFKKYYYIV